MHAPYPPASEPDVNPSDTEHMLKVGIVGGGQGGSEMLRFFSLKGHTRILFVADPNPQAPAMQSARKAHIPTLRDGVLAPRNHPQGCTLLSNRMALTLFSILQSRLHSLQEQSTREIREVRSEIEKTTLQSDELLKQMQGIATNTELLAINASIEAAHAREHGAAFAVVAEQMKKTARQSRNLVQDLGGLNQTITTLSNQLAVAIDRLRQNR